MKTIDYSLLDWTKRNVELAQETGLSPTTISKIRQKLQIPKSPLHRKKRPQFLKKLDLDWTTPDSLLAQELGYSHEWIRQLRKRAEAPKSLYKRVIQIKNYELAKKLDWTKQDKVLAKETGRSVTFIRNLRNVTGAPKSIFYRQKKYMGDYKKLDWTKTNAELQKESGLTFSYIAQMRKRLNAPQVSLIKIVNKKLRVITRYNADGNYYAVCQDIPGATAQGNTMKQAKENLRKMIKLIFPDSTCQPTSSE